MAEQRIDAPTPRTDSDEQWAEWNGNEFQCVHSDFARQLERETIALRDRVAELESALSDMLNLHDGKLLCRAEETDRECLNRETERIVKQARTAIQPTGGK